MSDVMFCKKCKNLIDDYANYCKDCGEKLISVTDLTIPRIDLSTHYIAEFLEHVLGYNEVRIYEDCVSARYRNESSQPIFLIFLKSGLHIGTSFKLNCDVSNDLTFFKRLNIMNNFSLLHYQYSEPKDVDEDEGSEERDVLDFGYIRVSRIVPIAKEFSLVYLYRLVKQSFEINAQMNIGAGQLGTYLGWGMPVYGTLSREELDAMLGPPSTMVPTYQ